MIFQTVFLGEVTDFPALLSLENSKHICTNLVIKKITVPAAIILVSTILQNDVCFKGHTTRLLNKKCKGLILCSKKKILGVESCDFSQAEKEITACKAEQIHKMTLIFTQNDIQAPF